MVSDRWRAELGLMTPEEKFRAAVEMLVDVCQVWVGTRPALAMELTSVLRALSMIARGKL